MENKIIICILISYLTIFTFPVKDPWGQWEKRIVGDDYGRYLEYPESTDNFFNDQSDTSLTLKSNGDGSWQITLKYPPGYIIKEYKFLARNDSSDTWGYGNNGGSIDEGDDRKRYNITIPANATDYYVIFHNWGSRGVRGFQGSGAESDTTSWRGVDQLGTEYSNENNDTDPSDIPYGMTAGAGTDVVMLYWDYGNNISSSGGHSADIVSADSDNCYYGFEVWRSAAGSLTPFSRIDTYIHPSDSYVISYNSGFDNGGAVGAFYFYDTSVTEDETYTYIVMAVDAYGARNKQSDVSSYTKLVLGRVSIIFVVMGYDENVIFKNGRNVGKVYLTPVINGKPNFYNKVPAYAIRVYSG